MPDRISALDGRRLLLSADSRAFVYDIGADSVLAWLEREEGSGIITAFGRSAGRLWLGDSRGATAIPDTFTRKTLESRHYIDLAASYNITEDWNVRVGVNNITDKDPPSTTETSGFSNGNTYAQTYDAQGRYLFVGTTIDF